MTDVEKLRNRVVEQRDDLLDVRKQLDRSARGARGGVRQVHASWSRPAPAGCRSCAATRPEPPSSVCPSCRRTRARLNDLLAALERARRDEVTRGRAGPRRSPAPSPPRTSVSLDWPVEGTIVYRFGRDTLPSGGIIRWNGIGIAAAAGTPVKAVESGKVRLVGQFGTYGLTVVLEHGNGYYSVYSHLQSAEVQARQPPSRGARLIGTVGGENSDYGPHLHFEIRGENQVALDPVDWLRKR